ncbi:hypothetical protein BV25DRAFT_1988809 [Artomyces pyxidatus]|uniref:Uncharacterized protein n=1 Tax=Artomyces pyxidatus TaxID=48021 RepID=A0ACB8TA62_9AGAM|nr:hypothetical protein BV25DRAFT_1988809 [Artomyces pyxidatus]
MKLFHGRLASPPTGVDLSLQPSSPWATRYASRLADWPKDFVFGRISDSRTKRVDFLCLQEAIERQLDTHCVGMEWVAEGGFNQIYLVSLADGSQIVARLSFPFPHDQMTGAAFSSQTEVDRARIPYRLLVEVETIRYVALHTTVPVARIYAFDTKVSNPIGTPYMLQELLKGDNVGELWWNLSHPERDVMMASLGRVCGGLLSLKFTSYGCISSHMAEEPVGPITPPLCTLASEHSLEDVGPWPCSAPFALMTTLAAREEAWMRGPSGRTLVAQWRGERHPTEDLDKTLPAFVELASRLLQLFPHLPILYPLPEEALRPALCHPDFSVANVMASQDNPANITGLVDWEFATVAPLFSCYKVPDSLYDYGDQNEPDPEERESKRRGRALFAQGVIDACPDAEVVVRPEENSALQRSLCGLQTLSILTTSGFSRWCPFEDVRARLVSLRESAAVECGPGVQIIDDLLTLFNIHTSP